MRGNRLRTSGGSVRFRTTLLTLVASTGEKQIAGFAVGTADAVGPVEVFEAADAVTERPEVLARGYRRFRCRTCGRQFYGRRTGLLSRTCLPCDVVALVVFCRLRYRLTLRDSSEILALRGIEVSQSCS